MGRPPNKSDAIAAKEATAKEAKRLQNLRERAAQMFHREVEVVRQVLVPEKAEKDDSTTAPNFPKGMRVIDYNAMREAQVLHEVYSQIRRGNYSRGDGGETNYAEPAVSFHIPMDKVPGGAINPHDGLVPAKWDKGKAKHERNLKAAKARAAQFVQKALEKTPKVKASPKKAAKSRGRRTMYIRKTGRAVGGV